MSAPAVPSPADVDPNGVVLPVHFLVRCPHCQSVLTVTPTATPLVTCIVCASPVALHYPSMIPAPPMSSPLATIAISDTTYTSATPMQHRTSYDTTVIHTSKLWLPPQVVVFLRSLKVDPQAVAYITKQRIDGAALFTLTQADLELAGLRPEQYVMLLSAISVVRSNSCQSEAERYSAKAYAKEVQAMRQKLWAEGKFKKGAVRLTFQHTQYLVDID